MRYYNVNGVTFSLVYLFDSFYNDNVEKYQIEETVVPHHIETVLVDEIPLPKTAPTSEIGNRQIYVCEKDETVIVFQDKVPVLLIEKAHDYSTCFLYMRKDLNGLDEIEYVYHGIVFMEISLYHSIQSLHGSAIEVNGKAVIFSAPSGTGKSTHVEYWKKLDSTIRIINDDKPLIDCKDGILYASGSPWSGKTKVNENVSIPLHSIVFLEQGVTNKVEELHKDEKLIHIMRNINRPRQDKLWDKVEKVLEMLLNDIAMYKATVTNSIDAATFVKDKIGV